MWRSAGPAWVVFPALIGALYLLSLGLSAIARRQPAEKRPKRRAVKETAFGWPMVNVVVGALLVLAATLPAVRGWLPQPVGQALERIGQVSLNQSDLRPP